MYVESVLNAVIFTDRLSARIYEEALGKPAPSIEPEIYKERESLERKVSIIFKRYKVTDYKQDEEFIEIVYLMGLRN